ncbi:MAG: DUF881 domain-containing protein [Clostridiaceae bacterium]|nr:DUF881 domain-containing protein [Clostridiaceae bacterium]
MKFKEQVAIAFVCLIVSFMISLHFKSVKHNKEVSVPQNLRAESLYAELTKEKEKNEELYKQILTLQSDLEMYRKEATDSSGYAKVLSEQMSRLEILAGATPVQGQGVIVTLDDSKAKIETSSILESEQYIIHDDDIRKVVNELYAAGAEAISINDDRLISTSSIRCVGPVVIINNNKYAPPIEIKAIGDADTLEAALTMRDGVRDLLVNIYRIDVTIRKEKNIVIPAYNGVVNFKYASPVNSKGE